MIYINNRDVLDQTLNFAMEEYALKYLDINETYLMFYRMAPTVIVGRNQNTAEEINRDYIRANKVTVTRRLSGGGAVYNDPGNLSFSFIAKDDGDSFNNYRKFTEPVIRALHHMGVEARLEGRNDLTLDGKKISGNAQFVTQGRIFSHGTLLFDVNLDHVSKALHPDAAKYESKGIKSVRSRVTNIREHLAKDMTIQQFRETLLHYIFEGQEKIPEYQITDEDWTNIVDIANKRYRNWEWVYGKSPEFNVQKAKRFSGGRIDLRMNVKKSVIEKMTIYGDFFGAGDVTDIEKLLVGTKYDRKAIEEKLNGVDVHKYFGKISEEELLSVLI
ncbi:lipoate--protein ligase [Sporolactobacillus sp. THM19-2]|jgi:lipoate-protein ligase A|uniref:lipoate--protein ligase n=1 Tax=Sporolactobacillus sp. THM19-2 TaxID=2511171 RepID=UPI00101FEBC8|nr:lipoate--protein ligase [Sporolactobacillus sp. THM19-2]RYL91518.1 lipoate--protein ligase [Sporolactobacillus sp. THM19-2]